MECQLSKSPSAEGSRAGAAAKAGAAAGVLPGEGRLITALVGVRALATREERPGHCRGGGSAVKSSHCSCRGPRFDP